MDFSFEISGLDRLAQASEQVRRAVILEINKGVYASAQQQTASTASDGNGASTSDDEVVEEGDYEVIDEEQEAPKA